MIFLIFGAQIFNAATLVIEEKIFMKYSVSPMYLLGWEGIYCVIVHVGLLTVYQNIPCTESPAENPTWCIENWFENSLFALKQIASNYYIILMMIVYVATSCGFRITGLYLVKVASAANRITIDVSRTVLIWMFFLCYPKGGSLLHESFDFV